MTSAENILENAILFSDIKNLKAEFRRNCAAIKQLNSDNVEILNSLDGNLNKIQLLAEERDTPRPATQAAHEIRYYNKTEQLHHHIKFDTVSEFSWSLLKLTTDANVSNIEIQHN